MNWPAGEGDGRVTAAVVALGGCEIKGEVQSLLCGGLTLLDRLLRQLKRAGITSVVLLKTPDGWDGALDRLPGGARRRWPREIRLVRIDGAAPGELPLLAGRGKLPKRFLYLPFNILIDQRILHRLLEQGEPILLDWGEATVGVLDLDRLASSGVGAARKLRLADVPLYHGELRRKVRPSLFQVKTQAQARQGSRMLLKHVQKGALDLPGRYFDTPFEDLLVRFLAPTGVTANAVTVFTTIAAFGVALLFWDGWFKVASLGALLIGILDGVDGKLARLKLETSRLGELEHIADFFYENAWYLAIASYLGMLPVGFLMVLSDLADNLAYLVVQRRHGRLLDEMSAFDRVFRQVAGRRNIYVWIFVIGFCVGSPPATFILAAVWALVTAAIHWLRALKWVKVEDRPAPSERPASFSGGTSSVAHEANTRA